ncbi:hypothetical protein AVEN_83843-1 [Araneus ventricosus]|uniref:Uncharacterized protein n=1 Tax=Araneus ventricosus TaxID=182803 RepID=A0A4Y2C7A1_ARAVE|nr:hypothetical protein AVEN_83843-1 [Araneus ventricosus]
MSPNTLGYLKTFTCFSVGPRGTSYIGSCVLEHDLPSPNSQAYWGAGGRIISGEWASNIGASSIDYTIDGIIHISCILEDALQNLMDDVSAAVRRHMWCASPMCGAVYRYCWIGRGGSVIT